MWEIHVNLSYYRWKLPMLGHGRETFLKVNTGEWIKDIRSALTFQRKYVLIRTSSIISKNNSLEITNCSDVSNVYNLPSDICGSLYFVTAERTIDTSARQVSPK